VKTEPGIHVNDALKTLARDARTSAEEVERIYKLEVSRLAAGARIRTFIPALALRKARAKLRNRREWEYKAKAVAY